MVTEKKRRMASLKRIRKGNMIIYFPLGYSQIDINTFLEECHICALRDFYSNVNTNPTNLSMLLDLKLFEN